MCGFSLPARDLRILTKNKPSSIRKKHFLVGRPLVSKHVQRNSLFLLKVNDLSCFCWIPRFCYTPSAIPAADVGKHHQWVLCWTAIEKVVCRTTSSWLEKAAFGSLYYGFFGWEEKRKHVNNKTILGNFEKFLSRK